MSQRIVVNTRSGNFGLSRLAFLRLRELGDETALEEPDLGEPYPNKRIRRPSGWGGDTFCERIPRDDPLLLQVIKELGTKKASAPLATLRVVAIPDGVKWIITNVDGIEQIEEQHRSWGKKSTRAITDGNRKGGTDVTLQ